MIDGDSFNTAARRTAARSPGDGLQGRRIRAGSSSFLLYLASDGLQMTELFEAGGASGGGGGFHLGPLRPDTPTDVVIVVDKATARYTATAAPAGTPLPVPLSQSFIRGQNGQDITAIDIGAPPGFATQALGVFWLDDLAIE
jgi:hypothetical protein